MPINITLKIGSESYDVLRCHYGFGRVVDSKGWPGRGMNGGDIILTMESTQSTLLFEEMVRKDEVRPVSGSLEFYEVDEGTVIRTIEWEEGYIHSLSESMQNYSSIPMTQTLAISPLRLDINGTIRIDRRFPQTQGFWWDEYKPEEDAVMAAGDDDTYTITDAYWLDEENNQIRDLDVEEPVTLYVVLGNYTVGSNVSFAFEEEYDEGVKRADCSGTVDEDGIVVIENFKLEPVNEEE